MSTSALQPDEPQLRCERFTLRMMEIQARLTLHMQLIEDRLKYIEHLLTYPAHTSGILINPASVRADTSA